MNGESSIKALALLRIAIGVLSWTAPNLAGTLFGLDVKKNKQAPYLARLFGIRDLVMGVGLLSTRGEARRLWLKTGVVCDAADAAAAALGYRDGYLPAVTATMVGSTALAATGMGLAGVTAEDVPLP